MPIEDVVTSSVFGPVGYMCPEDRRAAVDCLEDVLGSARARPEREVELRFWPRLRLAGDALRARYVEPDIMLADAAGAFLVLEVKWGAPLGEHELAAQWTALSNTERRRCTHVLLVQETERYRRAVDEDAALLERLGLAPWRPLVRSWRTLTALPLPASRPGRSDAVRLWAAAVADFVRREHRFSMHGWDQIGLRPADELGWRYVQPWFEAMTGVPAHGGWWSNE